MHSEGHNRFSYSLLVDEFSVIPNEEYSNCVALLARNLLQGIFLEQKCLSEPIKYK